MDLLRGQPALDRAQEIIADCAIPTLAMDPAAREAGGSISVLAICSPRAGVLIDPRATSGLDALFQTVDRPLAAHRAKTVHRALLETVGTGPARWACTLLSAQLLAAGRPTDLSLAAIAQQHGTTIPPSGDGGFGELVERGRGIAQLIERMVPALKSAGMAWVSKIEAAAVAPVAEMEIRGMPVLVDEWRQLTAAARAERESLSGQLRKHFAAVRTNNLFGEAAINLDSDVEVKEALTALGHAVPNLRRRTVAALPPPVGPWLSRYRELTKMVSTYGERFLEHVGPDRRVHPTFEQIGASTGRMACHSPNLQAMVKGGPYRDCFRAPEGRCFAVGDYAACELRILAEMSADPVFAEAFARNEDLHARVASEMFGRPVSKTQNPELRDRAKAINFGLAYGMGAGGLARTIGVDAPTARELLEAYFRRFPRIRDFLEESAQKALRRGWAHTLTGRRLDLAPGPDRDNRAQAERIAKNMPIQGTSADITKIALARLRRRLSSVPDAWMVNTVHDEIVIECNANRAEEIRSILANEMRRAGEDVLKRIPVVVDTAVGHTWNK